MFLPRAKTDAPELRVEKLSFFILAEKYYSKAKVRTSVLKK